MSKTIKQIADEIGVSKQAVQKRLSREPLCTIIKPYLSMDKGVNYIDVVGEKLIKTAFAKNNRQPSVDSLSTDNNDVPTDKASLSVDKNVVDVVVDVLKSQIETLQAQLEVKDKQIAEQSEQIRTLTESLHDTTAALTAAQALHAGTIQQQLTDRSASSGELSEDNVTDATTEQNRSFWQRIFGRK